MRRIMERNLPCCLKCSERKSCPFQEVELWMTPFRCVGAGQAYAAWSTVDP